MRGLRFKLLALLVLCAMPIGGSVSFLLTGVSPLPLLAYGVASLLAFGLYRYDKQQAKAGQWRTPEKILHGVELLGGWPGALVAQQMFRHKTRKLSYQLLFWLIVVVHQVVWVDVLFLNMSFIHRLLLQQ
ncbi:DUF1294 domain-containing protein [Pseudomonas bubulae]|uniref:DUF1294 domain-containing protein n=1 Tax=Pseudomonas bubulae TaxID=2316085 RepID=UPI001F323DE4|nr:DUF1294 domain-containing protein [Pseudomonas bubulae]MCF3194336.1 DUF1294 domain-containing protein [Pseudomonas bubulae]